MIRRNLRERAHHQRPERLGDDGQQASSLRHLHQAEEERHHAHEADGKGHRAAGRFNDPGAKRGHRGHLVHRRGYPAELAIATNEEGDEDDADKGYVHPERDPLRILAQLGQDRRKSPCGAYTPRNVSVSCFRHDSSKRSVWILAQHAPALQMQCRIRRLLTS